MGGEDFLRALILEFVSEGAQIVERMIAAVAARDRCAFQHEAHALSSSAGNLGAFGLALLCGAWKDLAHDEIVCHGDDYLKDLRREWSLAALALGKILARSAAASSRKPGRRRREVA